MSALTRRIEKIQEHAGITGRDIAQLLGTTPQTVSRWRQGRVFPQPDTLERLLKLDWLTDELSSVYEPEEAMLWLFSHHGDLGGARPADLIADERMDEVLAIIDQLQSGAYV